jgi:outer membrane protein OmpA-like peptidoglycan-associated protein
VQVEGYTDSVGGDAFNQQLSRQRAEAVRQALISRGVAPGRLSIKGYGKRDPIADNGTPQGRRLNRRVEFRIIEIEGDQIKEETAPSIEEFDDVEEFKEEVP